MERLHPSSTTAGVTKEHDQEQTVVDLHTQANPQQLQIPILPLQLGSVELNLVGLWEKAAATLSTHTITVSSGGRAHSPNTVLGSGSGLDPGRRPCLPNTTPGETTTRRPVADLCAWVNQLLAGLL